MFDIVRVLKGNGYYKSILVLFLFFVCLLSRQEKQNINLTELREQNASNSSEWRVFIIQRQLI